MFHAFYSRIKKSFLNQIIFSSNSYRDRANFFNEMSSFKKVMIVTGKNSYSISGANIFIEKILKGTDINIFNDFDVNPDINQINPGSNIANKLKPDAIIAIGGGSVIDAAKIIHHMHCNNLNEKEIFISNKKIPSKPPRFIPLIAIPTTAGTGSESTHFAVLYKDKKKFSIASKTILPNMVYLDEKLCVSNSEYQNACSGFDALSQAIESYWSKGSSILSRHYSKKALDLILDNFSQAVLNKKKCSSSMLNMLIASNYAGRAINITKTTAPHAISYGITQHIGLPHGHAVALTLGAFFDLHNFQFNNDNSEIKKKLKNFKKIENFIYSRSGKNPKYFLYELMRDFSMEYDIDKLGLNDEQIDKLVKNVNLERISNHPINICESDLINIFNLVPKKNDKPN
jgi:alcohol dehydrogenase